MTKYEYKIISPNIDTALLNTLGKDGWQLVSPTPSGNFIFMREIVAPYPRDIPASLL